MRKPTIRRSSSGRLATIRRAIRRERKLVIAYRDKEGRATRRVVWPFALAFFDRAQVVAAWRQLRGGFRHFRIDRIGELKVLEERYPRRRAALAKAWREAEGVPAP